MQRMAWSQVVSAVSNLYAKRIMPQGLLRGEILPYYEGG